MWDTLANTSWILIFFVFQKRFSQYNLLRLKPDQSKLKDKYVPKIFRHQQHFIVIKLRQYE